MNPALVTTAVLVRKVSPVTTVISILTTATQILVSMESVLMELTVLNVPAKQDIGDPSAKMLLRYKKVRRHQGHDKDPKEIFD